MIQMTERALEELQTLLQENQGKSLRVMFKGYG
jgi:Fe-S cluster assembly iron-binding protein IscA